MNLNRGRSIEVESLAELDHRVARGARSMSGWHLRSLDLRERGAVLARLDVHGALFLGCRFAAGDEAAVRERGGLVFPVVPDVPVDPYRADLYTPDELYDGLARSYHATLDARVYGWSKQPRSKDMAIAKALHDHAVDDALDDWVDDRRLVGVMGGHALPRGAAGYRDAATAARLLAATGLTVCTGGGPGAMEAANLGAYFAGYDEAALADAVDVLAGTPDFRPSVAVWARTAFEVLGRWPGGNASLGIPTWHYGHEPPNPFATAIAKYFKNAIREDTLLHLCDAGIVFLPGAGGTVQEIFQDACENYYADPAAVAPMVLVGREYWTQRLPAWPLLAALARDREMPVHLVESLEDVAPLMTG